jgi:DNA-binding CsgD family transcriptional regulator
VFLSLDKALPGIRPWGMPSPVIHPFQMALCVAALALGFIVIAVALLLHLQHRHRAMLHYAAFAGFGVAIGAINFLGLLRVPLPAALNGILCACSIPVVAGLCVSLSWFVCSLLDLTPPRPIRWLIGLPVPAALVALGFQLAHLDLGLDALIGITNRMVRLGYLWFFLEWIACCVLIGVCFRRITHRDVRRYLVAVVLAMAAWIPFWIREVVTGAPILAPYDFALLWATLSLYFAARQFFRPSQEPPAEPVVPGPLADAAMLDRFAEARQLTPRERDLCGLLVGDLSYAAIAERLFISEKTVRNHVSNIYGKVSVSSRLELIRSIRGQ